MRWRFFPVQDQVIYPMRHISHVYSGTVGLDFWNSPSPPGARDPVPDPSTRPVAIQEGPLPPLVVVIQSPPPELLPILPLSSPPPASPPPASPPPASPPPSFRPSPDPLLVTPPAKKHKNKPPPPPRKESSPPGQGGAGIAAGSQSSLDSSDSGSSSTTT